MATMIELKRKGKKNIIIGIEHATSVLRQQASKGRKGWELADSKLVFSNNEISSLKEKEEKEEKKEKK